MNNPEKPQSRVELVKRFEIQKDDFVHKRIEAVRQSLDRLKEASPEVVDFVMFGSMTKGTAKESSDIDGYIFVDTDEITERNGEKTVVDEVKFTPDAMYRKVKLRPEVSQQYSNKMRSMIKEGAALDSEQVGDVSTLPISREIIDNDLLGMADFARELLKFEENRLIIDQHHADGGTIFDEPDRVKFPNIIFQVNQLERCFICKWGWSRFGLLQVVLDQSTSKKWNHL